MLLTPEFLGFPGCSVGKESTCNVGDLGSILSWVDPLEEGMASHSSILTWRIPMDKALAGYSPWGHRGSDTTERLSTYIR